ncbi:MAG: 3'-5' exonuclease [Verrucomicrobiota bacterium]|jgi:DNA polymerase-3 subunit epsilon|nr:3'-5' exonuclease [Verrucomicrobiota bacterium]
MSDKSIPSLPPRLQLTRPLVVFDLEATGLNKKVDRIVSVALIRYEPDGTAQQILYFLNPTVPIPEEATAIHGITDEDVKDAPTFAEMAEVLQRHFEGADLAGYNILGYDIGLLSEEFSRANRPFQVEGRRVLDAQRIFFRNEPRDLSAALRYYCGTDHENSHDALGDVLATIQVLGGQFNRYSELPEEMDALNEYCDPRDPSWVDRTGRLKWSHGEVVFNFGKFQGRSLRQMAQTEPNVITWLLRSDFPEDTKQIVRDAVNGHYPPPPETPR